MSSEPGPQQATRTFYTHRGLLFTVAYEILGSATDAEDVLQETWLRWAQVDLDRVQDRRAYLLRIATRQALNHARGLNRRKETYVGSWLPEPLLTSPDVAEDVELAESVSTALLVVLETLSATERVVFVLHEVFGVEHAEIAATLEKSPAAVRQIAHRARRHVQDRHQRHQTSPAQTRAVVESFHRALSTGDLEALVQLLAPEVVYVADGGGMRMAARHPVIGRQKVQRLLAGGMRIIGEEFSTQPAAVNGGAGLLVHLRGTFDGVISVSVARGQITGLYYMRNPNKLGWTATPAPLTREGVPDS